MSDFRSLGPVKVWEFSGVAQGGTISFTVNGVPVEVVTTPGQTAEEVAAAVVSAMLLEPTGASAFASGNLVLTDGVVSAVTITDPGIEHAVLPSVPALPVTGLLLLGLLLVWAGRRTRFPDSRS